MAFVGMLFINILNAQVSIRLLLTCSFACVSMD